MRIGTDSALAQLRALIEVEAPAPGDRLPTERVLAARIGCSRATLRGALARLEAEGELWRRVGQGTFRGRAPIGTPLRDHLLLEATTPEELMDARLLLEPQVAAAAALRREPGDLAHLHARVAEGRAARDRAASERADDAFHQALAQVARNPVLIALLRHFSGARCRAVWQREWDRTYRRVGVAEFRGLHSDQHAAVVEAVAQGDAGAAQEAMARHLETVRVAMAGGAAEG
ncbi:FCD domain-containing protein [Roseivivax sp. GX 12232]|uniref:FadR/GntR family transcriptional regulator n=1 Tax=Roseivivax sp. GX 12232 TaxID=2900547 RepID=UPI001E4C802D|nr:FCD domain-containing protein [Roseivivax sp. GX 12232]MCE0505397.1 FCD domain-containing protein [Roseivivax sp. GX 12232]